MSDQKIDVEQVSQVRKDVKDFLVKAIDVLAGTMLRVKVFESGGVTLYTFVYRHRVIEVYSQWHLLRVGGALLFEEPPFEGITMRLAMLCRQRVDQQGLAGEDSLDKTVVAERERACEMLARLLHDTQED